MSVTDNDCSDISISEKSGTLSSKLKHEEVASCQEHSIQSGTVTQESPHWNRSNGLDYPTGENSSDQNPTEDLSPDISLSSQRTLRYCDVEPEAKEHDLSHDSSDSIETLEELPAADSHVDISESYLQQLTLTHQISGSSVESMGRGFSSSHSDDNISGESHEVITEYSNAPRPESLALPRPLQALERERDREMAMSGLETEPCGKDQSKLDKDSHQLVPDQVEGAQCLESEALSQNLPQGTIVRKGNMIEFVADDLQEKIKQSSPLSQSDCASLGSRRSSVRSVASASSSTSFATSSGMSRSPSSLFQQSPDSIPPIDASAVMELEGHASRVADSLDLMMGNIRNNLHKMSAITIGCQDAYKRSVDITCDSVDASIKTMYALMAKCEELSLSMRPVEQLAVQIKEIKRILDLFESKLTDK